LPNVGPEGRTNPNYGPYAPPADLPGPVRQQILDILSGNPATAPIFPFLSNLQNGQPIVALVSFENAGRVSTEGADVTLNSSIGDRWLLDGSYSWFDFKVRAQTLGGRLLPNAPEHKLSAGLTYRDRRVDISAHYRWVDGFPWADGIYVGPVPSYSVVDLAASYRLGERWELGMDVANLLDRKHWESFGGDLLRRRALGHVTFSW
jgi:outer membrane receptor protein involved in Fe transport